MSDPLDLDARMDELTKLVYTTRARGDALGLGSLAIGDLLDVIESDRAELRTARATIASGNHGCRMCAADVGVVGAERAGLCGGHADALAARIEAAVALHHVEIMEVNSGWDEPMTEAVPVCAACGEDLTTDENQNGCPTLRALSGATEPADPETTP